MCLTGTDESAAGRGARDAGEQGATRPGCGRARRRPEPNPLLPDGGPEWLDGKEWNVCYFLGLDAFHRGGVECTACEQVSVGMQRLAATGYAFAHLRRTASGGLEPRPEAGRSGEHEERCIQLGDGSFDVIGRARQAVGWLHAHAPEVPTSWLEELVALYDRTHEEADREQEVKPCGFGAR